MPKIKDQPLWMSTCEKNTVLWDVTLFLVEIYRWFDKTYCLHLPLLWKNRYLQDLDKKSANYAVSHPKRCHPAWSPPWQSMSPIFYVLRAFSIPGSCPFPHPVDTPRLTWIPDIRCFNYTNRYTMDSCDCNRLKANFIVYKGINKNTILFLNITLTDFPRINFYCITEVFQNSTSSMWAF
jgi:hypothetical protein